MSVLGIGIGFCGSWMSTRVLTSTLFGVSPTDPATFVAMIVLTTTITVVASYAPARRATNVDLLQALRCE